MHDPQLAADGTLAHLLTLEGLPAEIIVRILDAAVPFASNTSVFTISPLRFSTSTRLVGRQIDSTFPEADIALDGEKQRIQFIGLHAHCLPISYHVRQQTDVG